MSGCGFSYWLRGRGWRHGPVQLHAKESTCGLVPGKRFSFPLVECTCVATVIKFFHDDLISSTFSSTKWGSCMHSRHSSSNFPTIPILTIEYQCDFIFQMRDTNSILEHFQHLQMRQTNSIFQNINIYFRTISFL